VGLRLRFLKFASSIGLVVILCVFFFSKASEEPEVRHIEEWMPLCLHMDVNELTKEFGSRKLAIKYLVNESKECVN